MLGLGMFKLSFFRGQLNLLANRPLTDKEHEIEEDWDDELKDDIK